MKVGCGGVLRSRVHGICNGRLIYGEILSRYNLKVKEVMRNLTCVDLQILLVVIWLVLTRVKSEEISY